MIAAVALALAVSAFAAIPNPGFEAGLEGWRPLFTREPQADDLSFERKSSVRELRAPGFPETVGARNAALEVDLRTRDGTLEVFDRRSRRCWRQQDLGANLVVTKATAERVDHRLLTPGRDVQQTRFANGIAITVNSGATPCALPEGGTLGPLSYRVTEP